MNEKDFDEMVNHYHALFKPLYIYLFSDGDWEAKENPPKYSDKLVKCYYKPATHEGMNSLWWVDVVSEPVVFTEG